ncbi:uncharacterized protein LOC125236181 [Leguminivora glycinivorella]|uniref:uncharacterized protein LOC125236181 n=1 Tax=Leguminivora glycinivorella TaxID=1035111 RepID=UPI0020102C2C|nr:uncharacterized protein LOC125236181 [Leguminivora glycinivorella]
MGLLTIGVIVFTIALPLEASPILESSSVVHIGIPVSLRRYFGKPSSHFKYNYVPRTFYEEPKVSEESDSYIERLIREALQASSNAERERRSSSRLDIDTDYYLIIENDN